MITREQFEAKVLSAARKEMGWEKAQAHQWISVPDAWIPGEREEYLARQKAWEELCERGEKEGWLRWTNDYDDSHLETVNLRSDTHPTRMLERMETDEEREDRLELLKHQIESQVRIRAQRGWETFDAAQKLVNNYGRA